MSTLNDLLQQRQVAISMITAAGGELSPQQELELVENEKSLIQKVDATVAVREEFRYIANQLLAQIKELEDALEAVENYAERFDKRVEWVALNAGVDTLIGDKYSITIKPTKGSVEITNKELAQELYGVKSEVIKVPLEAIRADLDKGVDLGCAIIKQNYSIKTKINKGAK